MKKSFIKFSLLPISLLVLMPAYAAEKIDLMHHSLPTLNALSADKSNINMIETSRALDANKTLHVRVQQTYGGYPVWGADAVIHIPHADKNATLANASSAKNTYMNGSFYQGIKSDLDNTSNVVFEKAQSQKALETAIAQYQQKMGFKADAEEHKSELMVYIDSSNKAHWVYKISFFVPALKSGTTPSRPTYIMDAVTFHIYKEWNNIQTASAPVLAAGGGYGGNQKKNGKLTYDGLKGHLAKLYVSRDNATKTCTLQNSEVIIRNAGTNKIMSYRCAALDSSHNKVYWSGSFDAANGGYSPGNDALFGGNVLKRLYQDWYNVPVLTNPAGGPMILSMYVHDKNEGDNAHWDGEKNIMVFGDGQDYFYPLTSLGIAGHEVSHGFTQQHSNLNYEGQSGGMNESFSDMAAQASEVYAFGQGKNTWKIGAEIMRKGNGALRYMDIPSKDCNGAEPGDFCSIDDASQFYDDLDVHFSSGVYNRFFYLLSTSAGWGVRAAFDVMVQANSFYWTSTTDFNSGACGVLQAATDLKFDVTAVKAAFDTVNVDYSSCVIKS